jgi:hypothetical protein
MNWTFYFFMISGGFSDTRRHYYGCPVRSRSYFRHMEALFLLPCPKSKLLQTQEGIITAALSEVEATSDTRKHYYDFPARSQSYFRHKRALLRLPCPKLKLQNNRNANNPVWTQIHTGLLYFSTCSYIDRVPKGVLPCGTYPTQSLLLR